MADRISQRRLGWTDIVGWNASARNRDVEACSFHVLSRIDCASVGLEAEPVGNR